MQINTYDSRAAMGMAAAEAVAAKIAELLAVRPFINMVFAAAPSQEEFLAAFRQMPVEWGKIHAFHMDEYLDLGIDAHQSFGTFLDKRLFRLVPFRDVFYMEGMTAEEYSVLLSVYITDIVCMGIGENTHLAFNDPHSAKFDDPDLVKVVELDTVCRQQQVNDGCFAYIERVPTHAMTMTIPALMVAPTAFVIVPGPRKAEAVRHTLYGPVSEQYPSTVLRQHPDARLFLDRDSAIYLEK
ncbi:MAG TPA: 6-phosphogluconolactonase [Puia sp.]|nr:6-phosphogluconolactonase [Puia sp.]